MCIVFHSVPYSLTKVATHISEFLHCNRYLLNTDTFGSHIIIVTVPSPIELSYALAKANYASRCVLYIVAEGVPLVKKSVAKFLSDECYVVVPHRYVKALFEEAGWRVDDVVPHAIVVPDVKPQPSGSVGYMAINLMRKGIDLFIHMATFKPDTQFVLATTPTGELDLKSIYKPPNLSIINVPVGMEYKFYATLGLYVSTSRAEGFSLTPREFAAITGVAPIVSDIPVHDDPYMIRCKVKEKKTVIYRDMRVELVETDIFDCIKRLQRVAIDRNEVLNRYPITLYSKLMEALYR